MQASSSAIVAVDVDEVLAHFIPALAKFHNEEYQSNLTAESFHSYQFHEVWGGTVEECSSKMDQFYTSKHFLNGINPVDGALDGLRALRAATGCELHIVTARQLTLETATRAWIDTHYPDMFAGVHFGNHYGSSGEKRSKPQMCREIGAICLIDDSQIYAGHCADENIPCVLYGNYAWNSNEHGAGGAEWLRVTPKDKSDLIQRAHDWDNATKYLQEIVLSREVLPKMASIQMCSSSNKSENLLKIEKFATEAKVNGASMICLPECCCFMGNNAAETLNNAETIDGPSIIFLCNLSKTLKVWLSIGGFPLLATDHDDDSDDEQRIKKIYNHHLLLSPTGEIVGRYSKIHLFDNPLTGMLESKSTKPGKEIISINHDDLFCTIGLTICYDLRFPEQYSKLRRDGCNVILIPSAFMKETGKAHWEVLLRARAIENQCYIIAAAQVGEHNHGTRYSYGHSMIIDCWGNIISSLDGEEEGICYANFDRRNMNDIKLKMPVYDHRKDELY